MNNQSGCSWIVLVGSLFGLIVGGLEGIRDYRAAVDADHQRGGPGDYLPVGVPVLAVLGMLVGAFLAALAQIVWGLIRRSTRPDAKRD